MAIIANNTTFPDAAQRGTHGAYTYLQVALGTATATTNVQIPINGKIAGAFVTAGATILDGSNKYTLTLVNKSQADASIVASVVPAAAAYTKATDLTIVAAGSSVNRGDVLAVGSTVTGTIAGGGIITIVVESRA